MIKYDWKNNSKIKETVKGYLRENKTCKQIAAELDTSYCTIERAIVHYNLREDIPAPEKSEKGITAKQQSGIARELIYLIKEELATLPPEIRVKAKIKINGDTLVIQFTDWHIGKVVKDEFGVEIYNVPIFRKRINKLLSEILGLLDSYISKGTPIRDVVILCTGDILDGMGIYASQATKSELAPPFQVILAAEVIRSFILALLARKLPVKFYGVKGNHGEIRGEGGKSKDPNANWDLMLYLMLDWWTKDNMKGRNLEIHYSELDYMNVEIQGWRYNVRHIAPVQAEAPQGKGKILAWAKKHKVHGVVYGHYHHWGINDRSGIVVVRGGSVCGQDDLSEAMGEESDPAQLIWGVCKDRPLSFAYPVDLGKK